MNTPHPTSTGSPEPTDDDPRPAQKWAVVGKYMTTTGRIIRTAAPALPLLDVVPPFPFIISVLGAGLTFAGRWLSKRR